MKINCILPSSPWLADSKTNIPLGALYLAAVLRDRGHEVVVTSRLNQRIGDPATVPDAALDADAHLLSFCTPQFNEALELADYVRRHARHPRPLVVAGGPHASYEPEETAWAGAQKAYHVAGPLRARRVYRNLRPPLFDATVAGEGEDAVLAVLADWTAGRLAPRRGAIYAPPQVADLDAVPYPAWDLLPDDHIFNDGVAVMKRRYVESPVRPGTWPCLSVIGTRGCPYKCTYCSTPGIGQKPRMRSPANIVGELRRAVDAGIRMFKFQDDTYTLHRTKLRALAEVIGGEFGDAIACRVHTRVNTMGDHIAESLRLMRTRVVCFGVETGSQAVLDANWKGTKVAQATEALRVSKAHGLYTIVFLVVGMAGETWETMRETQDWLLAHRALIDSCNLAVGIPYPGSRWWSDPDASGIEILDFNYDNQWIVGFAARDEVLVRPRGVTVDDMFRIKAEMFRFLVEQGWAKAEWDDDARIRQEVAS